jgi:hypothetical protein
MNNESYTSYPREREVLLYEGYDIEVLDVEKDVTIENPNKSFKDFNGRKVTIIHLIKLDRKDDDA